jgi:sugar/nucleoside kinase (ribokinase family)
MPSAGEFSLPNLNGHIVCSYGELIADRVVVLRKALEVNGQTEGNMTARLGGSAATVARMATKHSARARFIGHAGQDTASREMLEVLESEGIDLKVNTKGKASSVLALQLASGECAFIHDLGDRGAVKPEDIDPSWLDDVAMLHVNGQNLYYEPTRATFLHVLNLAKERNIPLSFDVAAANLLADFGTRAFEAFLDEYRPAVLMCNEHEGDLLGLPWTKFPSVGIIIEHRSRASTRLYFDDNSDSVDVEPASGYWDYVGCDDAFFGGFLAGWLQQKSLQGAVLQGHASSRQHLESIAEEPRNI